eukprot:TRINITY_DN959_c0_g1_i1.p1 TRINITY_DN959_c0_g1~~TRINITY_DN959_c0_g1_i1.p1  ORF type:complete len:216 (+),score=31.01 TRINITY_DN959_c0_g1_i1:189-836(+)
MAAALIPASSVSTHYCKPVANFSVSASRRSLCGIKFPKSRAKNASFGISEFSLRSHRSLHTASCKSTADVVQTQWIQKTFSLRPYNRGCHIITQRIYEAVPEIREIDVGLANLFILHTSASLTINENASSDVPLDMEDALNRIVPEGNHYRHLDEGYDDMPAHVKSSMMGCSLTIPIKAGRFLLGIWQGVWLNEHRDYGGPRRICVTLQGMRTAG